MADLINPTTGDDGKPEWYVAGYVDFSGEYHDYEGQDFPDFPEHWHSDTDLVTIGWTDAENGSTQYGRLEGPFNDEDDLDDAVDTYFESGSP